MTNVVLLHTDDTGRWIGPYGAPVSTPRLNGFAEEAMTFRNMFSTSPHCSPSRASLMTSLPPHVHGITEVSHFGYSLDDYSKHLVQFLNREGYETVLSGQQHETPQEDDDEAKQLLGYDTVFDASDEDIDADEFDRDRTARDYANARALAQYLRERESEQPIFCSYGMYNTHRSLPTDRPSLDPGRVMMPSGLPDTPVLRREMAAFNDVVEEVDACVGIVLDAIEAAGMEDDTIVIFTTDHGMPFPGHKHTLYDTGIGVSFLMRVPGVTNGETSDALVSQMDLFPTLCSYLECATPPWVQGHPLDPILENPTESIRDAIFAEYTLRDDSDGAKCCIRTDRHKLIRLYGDRGKPARNLAEDRSMPPSWGFESFRSWDFTVEEGLHTADHPTECLLDCYWDPNERQNLIQDSGYTAIRDELRTRLDAWLEETSAPYSGIPNR